jgi:hypothetical protein
MEMNWVGDKTSYREALWTGYKNLPFRIYEEIVLYRCKLYDDFCRNFRDFDNMIMNYDRLDGFGQETLWE